MDTSAITTLIFGSLGVGVILRMVVKHLLGRGTVRQDEATKIRAELRSEIDRKDTVIDGLERRITTLEAELDKTERERNQLDVHLNRYKLDVYRQLVSAGVGQDLLESVLALQ